MTVANVYGLEIPPVPISGGNPTSISSNLMDAVGEKFAIVCQAPKTGSIRKVHFRTGTVTTPTDTDVRIESVSLTDGNPSGSLLAANTNVTVASGSITSDAWITSGALTADASVTKGDLIAVVIAPSGTPNYNVTYFNFFPAGSGFPYAVHYTASWAKQVFQPNFALEFSDGSFAFIPSSHCFSSVTSQSVQTTSNPDEVALKFQLPAPVRVDGAWVFLDLDANADIVLYDSDGTTALATASLDTDVRNSANRASRYVTFSSSIQLSAATAYRLAIKPTTTTSVTCYYATVASVGLLDQLAGGQNFHYSARVDAGAWTDTTTRRLLAGLIIDGIDDGAGGGGGGGGIGRLAGGALAQ